MRNKRGDTIVEVMIAIIVLGAALGAAFAIANRSQKTTQANHERYQAQLIVNSQAEILRQKYAQHVQNKSRDLFANDVTPGSTASGGCFGAGNNWTTTCDNIDGLYSIKVSKILDASSGKPSGANLINPVTYTIRVEWDGLNGVRQNVELQYGL